MASDSFTKLLLHCDGVDAATTFIDSATSKAITAVGTAQVDTAQSKFGGASLLLDGDSDYLRLENTEDFNFGTGNFTIDCWVRFNAKDAHQNFFAFYNTGDVQFLVGNDNKILIYVVSSTVLTTAGTIAANNWYHIAFVRNGNNWQIYVNGVSDANATDTRNMPLPNGANKVSIGSSAGGTITQFLNGWIDEFRVSKGIARWTANFTPPSRAYDKPGGGLGIGNPYIF